MNRMNQTVLIELTTEMFLWHTQTHTELKTGKKSLKMRTQHCIIAPF